jgi:hypothetical protein
MPHQIFHRPTFTKKAALKFLPFFETLLTQLRNQKPEGMFISCAEFGGISVNTLQVRWGDALRWLTQHNISETEDRRADFITLKDHIKNRREGGGLRIYVMFGPLPETSIRLDKDVKSVSQWKGDFEDFMADDDRNMAVFENIVLTEEELDWVKRVVGNLFKTGSVTVSGDKLVVVKT